VDFLQTGSAVLSVPHMDAFAEFVADFDMYVGGGTGSEGISFNVGDLPDTYFDERGAGSGLTVIISTTVDRIEIWYAGALLAQAAARLQQRDSPDFVPIRIALNDAGVLVRHGRAGVVLENVTLPGWSPQPTWRIGFGARTGSVLHDAHLLDNLRIRAGSAYRNQSVDTEISMNAQEQTADGVGFSYYAEPLVSRVDLDRGPVSGGTSVAVSGSSFRGGSVFRCRFGGSEVNATYVPFHDQLHCVTPASTEAGSASVEISLNGQQFTSGAAYFL